MVTLTLTLTLTLTGLGVTFCTLQGIASSSRKLTRLGSGGGGAGGGGAFVADHRPVDGCRSYLVRVRV